MYYYINVLLLYYYYYYYLFIYLLSFFYSSASLGMLLLLFFNNDFHIYYFNLIYEHNDTSRKNLNFFTAIRSSQSKIDAATSTSLERDVAAMGCRIDPSWMTHISIYRFSQSSTTGVTKVVVCVIMSVGCSIF